jgi:cytochrome c-type biogenesis protein CcmF
MVLSVLLAIALLWMGTGHVFSSSLLGLSLSLWIILSVSDKQTYRLIPGMTIAHTGFAVLIIGILLSSSLSQESEVRLKPGNATTLGPYQFFFVTTEGISGSNYRGIRGTFEVIKNTRHIINMYPEKRIYLIRDMIMTKVDIHPGIFRDLYIALGEPLDNDYWSVRIYYKPFMRWVWGGGILMILGGIIALCQRKQLTHRG